MRTILVTPPAQLISTATLKSYLRVDGSLEDATIDTMIKTATRYLEDYLSLKFNSQVWDIWLDGWPCSSKRDQWWDGVRDGAIGELYSHEKFIKIPFGRIISLDSFSTFNSSNVELVHTPGDYIVDTVSYQGRIGLNVGQTWPTTFLRPINAIKFRVTVGLATVPDDILQAVKELTAFFFENRGDENREIPPSILGIVSPYKELKLG